MRRGWLAGRFLLIAWLVSLVACGPESAAPVGSVVEIDAPLGLPAVPFPADNPPTAETIELGRRLFYEKRLSIDGTVSCATCHDPAFGFADGKALSSGIGGKTGARNAPTIWNAAYHETQFHDGRAATLEEQIEGPVTNPVEMAETTAGVVRKLEADAGYRAEFSRAFGEGPITFDMVAKAIATFERTVVSGASPFDRFRFGGEEDALTEQARRGWEIFRDPERGNCTICHLVGAHTATFTDGLFHNIGTGVNLSGEWTDLGRNIVTSRDRDRGAFKTPSLRNVALTAPYMHDGSFRTLHDVLSFYSGGGRSNPHLDPDLRPVILTGQDRTDLIAFLESLTGETPANLPHQAQ